MADLRDITGKNRKFTGTAGVTISSGATPANRTNEEGRFRYNTTTNLVEFYDGTEWKSVDTPPVITALNLDSGGDGSSFAIDSNLSGNATIVITGSFFSTSASVLFLANSGSNISPSSTTVVNSNRIECSVPYSSFAFANEPYQVRITNPSGLLFNFGSITVDTALTFNNAANTTVLLYDGSRTITTDSAVNILALASDAENDTITYALTAGSLPGGLSLSTSTGRISGTATAVGSDTTSTFTVSATASSTTISRQFGITVKAPVTVSVTSTGPGTFAVPDGLTSVDVLVVAGGAGSAAAHEGGGGAGGLIFRPSFPVTPGTPVAYNVGNGGPQPAQSGQNSTFGTLTAVGGGGNAQSGGSGGGAPHSPGNNPGPGTQPIQPGDSGSFGFGNPGGGGFHTSPPTGAQGGGGGGAAQAGTAAGPNNMGPGGAGREYSISGAAIYYSGGGAGGGHQNATGSGNGGIGGGGNAGRGPGARGQAGTANRGGGAGGGNDSPTGESGGSGIIIYKY